MIDRFFIIINYSIGEIKMDVYEVIKTIGSGSFGQVYMVRHKREGKNYVIKKVKTRDMNPKDLENTENEVTIISLTFNYQYRCVSSRKFVTLTLSLTKTPSLTGNPI
jgi:serine/threonine protein kinase